MARGGRRAGAGRKPGPPKAVVLGLDGVRRPGRVDLPPAASAEERESLLEPPTLLSEDARAGWEAYAATAISLNTLHSSTVAGFIEFCERWAYVQALDERIRYLGRATQEALPYLRERKSAAALLGQSLKDFKLTAFGKPVTSEKPKVAANPWAQVAHK